MYVDKLLYCASAGNITLVYETLIIILVFITRYQPVDWERERERERERETRATTHSIKTKSSK